MDELVDKLNSMTKQEFDDFLKKENLSTIHNLKLYLDDLYYNTGEDTIEDYRYDVLKEILVQRDPDYVPPVGAELRSEAVKVKLPYFLGGAEKITPKEPDKLKRWLKKHLK